MVEGKCTWRCKAWGCGRQPPQSCSHTTCLGRRISTWHWMVLQRNLPLEDPMTGKCSERPHILVEIARSGHLLWCFADLEGRPPSCLCGGKYTGSTVSGILHIRIGILLPLDNLYSTLLPCCWAPLDVAKEVLVHVANCSAFQNVDMERCIGVHLPCGVLETGTPTQEERSVMMTLDGSRCEKGTSTQTL